MSIKLLFHDRLINAQKNQILMGNLSISRYYDQLMVGDDNRSSYNTYFTNSYTNDKYNKYTKATATRIIILMYIIMYHSRQGTRFILRHHRRLAILLSEKKKVKSTSIALKPFLSLRGLSPINLILWPHA